MTKDNPKKPKTFSCNSFVKSGGLWYIDRLMGIMRPWGVHCTQDGSVLVTDFMAGSIKKYKIKEGWWIFCLLFFSQYLKILPSVFITVLKWITCGAILIYTTQRSNPCNIFIKFYTLQFWVPPRNLYYCKSCHNSKFQHWIETLECISTATYLSVVFR